MDFKMHEYTHALVARLSAEDSPPPSVGGAALVDFAELRHQRECLVRLLRELNVEVMEVDLKGSLEDKLLLENVAVICHGIALLPKPTPTFDKADMKVLRDILKGELGQTIVEINDPDARICGSDVLFTGREFFVGVGGRTNEAGAAAVADAFPEFPCTPIEGGGAARPLKRLVSVAGAGVVCAGAGREARALLRRMEREASGAYRTLTVPEDAAADCLYANGTLVHRAIEEIPQGFRVFCERVDYARRSICFAEPAKLGAALASCCLLVRAPYAQ